MALLCPGVKSISDLQSYLNKGAVVQKLPNSFICKKEVIRTHSQAINFLVIKPQSCPGGKLSKCKTLINASITSLKMDRKSRTCRQHPTEILASLHYMAAQGLTKPPFPSPAHLSSGADSQCVWFLECGSRCCYHYSQEAGTHGLSARLPLVICNQLSAISYK